MAVSKAFAIIAIFAVVACSSRGGAPGIPAVASPVATSSPQVGAAHAGRLQFSVSIPNASKTQVRPAYVSASTQGMNVALSGPTAISQTLALTPSSPGCSASTNGTTCTFTLPLAPCPSAANCYTGTMTTYDAVTCVASACTIPASAHALSSNQLISFSIAANTTNAVSVTLNGIPASVKIAAVGGSLVANATGFAASKCLNSAQNVVVIAVDAGGNQIVGPGAPTTFSLTSNSTHLTVAAGSVPGSYQLVPPSTLTAQNVPNPGSVIQLTASVTPLAGSGGSTVRTTANVTFSHDICGIFTLFPMPTIHTIVSGAIKPYPVGIAYVQTSQGTLTYFTSPQNGLSNAYQGVCYLNATLASSTYSGVSCFPAPNNSSAQYCTSCDPTGITLGPDGNIYWTETGTGSIGETSPGWDNVRNDVTIGSSTSPGPQGITSGPDGALWIADAENGITRFTTSGSFTTYSIPWGNAVAQTITTGPDGNLWFTDTENSYIGTITPGGAFLQPIKMPNYNTTPWGIVTGSDGNLWFTTDFMAPIGGWIGRLSTSGSLTVVNLPSAASNESPQWVTEGPDGAVWFTQTGTQSGSNVGYLGRVTTSQQFSQIPVPAGSSPQQIITEPDGNLWYADNSATPGIMRVQ